MPLPQASMSEVYVLTPGCRPACRMACSSSHARVPPMHVGHIWGCRTSRVAGLQRLKGASELLRLAARVDEDVVRHRIGLQSARYHLAQDQLRRLVWGWGWG